MIRTHVPGEDTFISNKCVFLIIDGLGDLPVPVLDGKTPLEAACTPVLDRLAGAGRYGLVDPTAPGAAPHTHSGCGTLMGLVPEQSEQLKRGPVEAAFKHLLDDVRDTGSPAAAMVEKAEQRLCKDLDRIEHGILRADQARVDAVRKQVDRLCTTLHPWRTPQERVYTVISFLFAHGWALIPRLMDALDVEQFGMNEVEL